MIASDGVMETTVDESDGVTRASGRWLRAVVEMTVVGKAVSSSCDGGGDTAVARWSN